MKYCLTTCFIIFALAGISQKIKEVKYTHPNERLKVTGFMKWQMKDSIWTYCDTSGNVRVTGHFKQDCMDGPWTYYYEGGSKAIEGSYSNSRRTGSWIFYYPEGNVMGMGNFSNDKEVVNSWKYFDPSGNEIVDDSIYPDLSRPAEFLYLGESGCDSNDPYAGMKTTFVSGDYALYYYLAANMPAFDLLFEKEYKCFIQFTLQKNGTVSDVSVIKSFSADFDKNVTQSLLCFPISIPAFRNGVPVNARFTLPYKYSHGGTIR